MLSVIRSSMTFWMFQSKTGLRSNRSYIHTKDGIGCRQSSGLNQVINNRKTTSGVFQPKHGVERKQAAILIIFEVVFFELSELTVELYTRKITCKLYNSNHEVTQLLR